MATGSASGSAEATGTLSQEDISKLYVAIFNRASEGEGNEYWQGEADLAAAANKMLATADAKEYFGTALDNDKSFIEWIYKNTFDKTYEDDAKGIDYWASKLANGESRGQVVADIVTAATAPENAGEAQLQFNHRVEISNHMAETIYNVVDNYKVATGFDADLKVTADEHSLENAIDKINSMTGDVKASLSWAIKEGIVSDTLEEFLDKEMPELKSNFSDGIKETMEKLSHSSTHLKKDVDDALEKLEGMNSEYSQSLKNVLSFLHHTKIDASVSGALNKSDAEIKGSLDVAVANGEISKDVADFIKEELPKLKAGVDVSGELNEEMKANIKGALSNDNLSADMHGLLSILGCDDDSKDDSEHKNGKEGDTEHNKGKTDSDSHDDTDHDNDKNDNNEKDDNSKDDSHHMIREKIYASESHYGDIHSYTSDSSDAHIGLIGVDTATAFDGSAGFQDGF